MFTGIVVQRPRVRAIRRIGRGARSLIRLSVELERPVDRLVTGDSLALDGVCLTALEVDGLAVDFDVIPETLRRTTLGHLSPGDRVNLEPALRVGGAMGGHVVQGHVDGVGTVETVTRRGKDVRMTIRLPEGLRGATIEKGSVTVDGVSLTVGESEDARFSVYLIPHTLKATGLSAKKPGDAVNLEADAVGRWVEQLVMRAMARLTGGDPGHLPRLSGAPKRPAPDRSPRKRAKAPSRSPESMS